uniref:Uncharacterized protein n=1 Tax=Chromera velia CCMP2878 TaxID=1169474 RepID=A0A0G4HB00_9ALVE|eukprot:Cvel_25716.t1-p1 / transcript=Cvel_25716.t1 / gene=Cvel_25716 / organism=Chromera_velia_CCMP2878 / gene_product=hypothetical protein / transcript_product=hypothetical protein / location=Cvel_scaffold2953:17482-21115(+) / protein_length=240 / sequence_SO=supercontig / SO=protein_coding / is_pseudo=false
MALRALLLASHTRIKGKRARLRASTWTSPPFVSVESSGKKAAVVEEVACFHSKDLTRIVKESSVLSGEVVWVEMTKVVDLVGAQSCLLLVQTIWGQVDVNLLACLLRWLGGTLLGRDLDQEATVAAGIVVNGFCKLLLQGEEPLLCRILICLGGGARANACSTATGSKSPSLLILNWNPCLCRSINTPGSKSRRVILAERAFDPRFELVTAAATGPSARGSTSIISTSTAPSDWGLGNAF